MADSSQFKNTDLHTITRQQVYNIWISLTRREWERNPEADFRSEQMLVEEQEGYFLIEGLQEPCVSLAFTAPFFNDKVKYNRMKMTEIFIDSTFGTNKHGYELYCVITELDLVSLPLSYLLLDTSLTAWLTALRASGLEPTVVHTDKDFAGKVTAASIAFKRDNVGYNHHLCLWNSLRAIDQYITALPQYLHYLSDEAGWILSNGRTSPCTRDQARTIRAMLKRHLLRHPLLPKPVFDTDGATPPDSLQFQSYEEIHRYSGISGVIGIGHSSGMLDRVASLCGRPGFNAIIPISRTTMRLESHWTILKKDYGSDSSSLDLMF
ncbi:hypothetical protein V1509DRAFT_643507 [Lipomyces kononenkoae]